MMRMGRQEKLTWLAVLLGIATVFYLSGDGFYRSPCQNPSNWPEAECNPPICSWNKTCPHDLVGNLDATN